MLKHMQTSVHTAICQSTQKRKRRKPLLRTGERLPDGARVALGVVAPVRIQVVRPVRVPLAVVPSVVDGPGDAALRLFIVALDRPEVAVQQR